MTLVPIQIPPGIVVDDTTFSTGQSAWGDMDKVRFWRGQPQVIGGWERLTGALLTGVCRSVFPWTDNAGQVNIAFGTHTNLELWIGGQLFDITPAAFIPGQVDGSSGQGYGTGTYGSGLYSQPSSATNYPMTWSLADYGQTLMANPRGQSIFQWSNATGSPAVPLTNAPANVTYMLVANTRQVLAFGCNEEISGVFNPRCIRGSDIEDPTDWTTGISSNAFEFILEGSGNIVAARIVGDYLFVWTDNGLYQGSFDATNGWLFPLVSEHCGLIGPNAAVVISNQAAFWMGSNGQFQGCVLGGVPQIIPCPLQADLFNNITPAQNAKIVASSCAEFGEIRFDYPDVRDGVENSRYVVYSTGGNLSAADASTRINTVWAKGTMVRTAYVDAGPSPYPVGVDSAGVAYIHERGQSGDAQPIDAYVESADFYVGNAQNIMQIRGMWPDVQSQVGALSLTVKMRFYPQANQRSHGPFALSPGQSKKDFMCSGRIARIRYESNAAPTFWRLGKPVYDGIQAGIR